MRNVRPIKTVVKLAGWRRHAQAARPLELPPHQHARLRYSAPSRLARLPRQPLPTPTPPHSKQRVFHVRPGRAAPERGGRASFPAGLPPDFDRRRDWYYTQTHTQVRGGVGRHSFNCGRS